MKITCATKKFESWVDYQTIISVISSFFLVLLFGYFFNLNFIKFNGNQAVDFIFSARFVFFAFSGYLLCQKWVSDRYFNYLFFLLALYYLLVFHGKHIDPLRMAGDNICQIAYWNVLSHQNLTGAIGASLTKPGHILILGVLNSMSLYAGSLVFKVGQSLVMAVCLWSLVRIATDIGGRVAGVIVFPVAVCSFIPDFLQGSSTIFLIPSLFIGLWLYYYKSGFKTMGRFLLVLSIQFHIHAVAVLFVIWLLLLVKKERKELGLFSLYSFLSVAIWVSIILRVQGTFERLNSGAAVGYISPLSGNTSSNSVKYMLDVFQEWFSHFSYIRSLIILCVIGIIGAVTYGHKMYLIVFSSMLVLVINVVMLEGTFNLERYCSSFYAFGCAVGIGTIIRYAREIQLSGTLVSKICFTLSVLILLVSFDYSSLNLKEGYCIEDYIIDAKNILSEPLLHDQTRLMTEDDIIYSLVVLNPNRFLSFTSLQYFNVADESTRKKILINTDYILISLKNEHIYYYLFYNENAEWSKDAFRMLILEILSNNQPSSLYGYSFLPIDMNEDRLILKVEKAPTR